MLKQHAERRQVAIDIKLLEAMKELVRTNDAVLLSWLTSLLAGEGIESFVLDQHMSVLDGSIGALPQRLMVIDEDYRQACRLLEEVQPEWAPQHEDGS